MRCNDERRFFIYSVMNSLLARHQLERAGTQSSPNLATRPAAVVTNGFASLKVVVDWARGEICHRGGRRCKLSTRETALLACLARKAAHACFAR